MKAWIKKVFGFGIASFLSDASHEMTVSLIPVIVAQFIAPPQLPFILGIIASITGALGSFLRLFAGFAADITSRKKPLIALGYALSAIFSTLTGFAHSLWAVLLYRILSFTGSGLREPPRDALIAASVSAENYGRAFGFKNAMDTTGSLVGPLVALALASTFSTKSIFMLSIIPGIAAVAAIIFLTQEIPSKDVPTALKKKGFFQHLTLLPESFIWFLAIIFIFELSFFDKLLILARAQEILIVNHASLAPSLILMYAIFNISRALSEFIIGLISDYINRLPLLAFFGCFIFSVTALLLTAQHASYSYCSFIFAVAGLSTAAITTLKKACAADMLPEEIRGLGYGSMSAMSGIATLISSSVVGLLWTIYSPAWAFSYVMALSTCSTILLIFYWLLPNR